MQFNKNKCLHFLVFSRWPSWDYGHSKLWFICPDIDPRSTGSVIIAANVHICYDTYDS